jgi:pSer/pThr/pTyr-binding forkhead associated (FHA) protein
VIGRGSDADVRVDDPKVSRKHASIFYTGSEFRIRDESSINGTVLNGSRVVEYAIRDGDELVIGETLLRFRVRA